MNYELGKGGRILTTDGDRLTQIKKIAQAFRPVKKKVIQTFLPVFFVATTRLNSRAPHHSICSKLYARAN